MKQYTNESQTAKLIELGFEKPEGGHRYWRGNELVINNNYTIGELIEMLLSKPHCRVSIYNVGLNQYKALFKKLINRRFKVLFREIGDEPIDLLFNGIVQLKEEGVI